MEERIIKIPESINVIVKERGTGSIEILQETDDGFNKIFVPAKDRNLLSELIKLKE